MFFSLKGVDVMPILRAFMINMNVLENHFTW